MAICHGKNKKGEPCGFPAKAGDLYCRHHRPDEPNDPLVIYRRLQKATPEEKTEIVLKLIEAHPEGRLELPKLEGMVADLRRIDLSPGTLKMRLAQWPDETPLWWNGEGVNLGKADLVEVNLQDAILEGANLQDADLEGANLQEVYMVGANLQEAGLGGANLQKANLVLANLQNAILGQANLQEADLVLANLQEAYLWGVNLQKANLTEASLQETYMVGANLQEAGLGEANLQKAKLGGANLQEAYLMGANLQEAYLWGVSLQEATLGGANLQDAYLGETNLTGASLRKATLKGANLGGAKLQGVDLLSCNITNIYLADAWLDKTRLRHTQLGGAIGEEIDGDYTAAKNAYLILKQNFDDLGDYEGSSWAYLKERRMEKLEARQKAREALTARHWKDFAAFGGKFLGDQLIEIVSDYGEGFWRVLLWIALFILIIGPTVFWSFGSFEWSDQVKEIYFNYSDRWDQNWLTYRQILLYTIDTFTTANFAEIKPKDDFTRFTSGCLAMWGIFLVGLLGFVAGNRIRRS